MKKKKKKNGYHRKRFLNAKKVQVQSCFSFQVNFHYPNNVDDLEDLIDQFKKKQKNRESAVDDYYFFLDREHAFGQNQKLDRFIVINDVLDLASGVLKNSCIYIFHIIYLEKSIWKLILLQVFRNSIKIL